MANKKSVNADLHHMQTISFDKEMVEVGLFKLFYSIGLNMIVLSLIYFMYADLHYEIWQIFLFYFFWQLGFTVSIPFVGGIIERIGIKHSIALSAWGSMILFLSLPYILSENFWMTIAVIFPVFVMRAMGHGASCIAYDIFLTHHLNKTSKGSALAWIQIAIAGAGVISPLLGAVITHFLGFSFVTIVGVVFFLLSISVLMYTPDEKVNIPYSSGRLMNDVKHFSHYLLLAEFGKVFFDSILWIVWPVFLLILMSDLVSMGAIVSASSALSILLAYGVGKWIDSGKKQPSRMLKTAAYRSAFLNFLRAVWLDPFILSFIDSLNKVNNQTLQIPYDIEFYKWVKEGDSLEKVHMRQMISENIYAVSLLLFAGIFWVFPEAPAWLFISIFGLGALSLLLLSNVTLARKNGDSSTF